MKSLIFKVTDMKNKKVLLICILLISTFLVGKEYLIDKEHNILEIEVSSIEEPVFQVLQEDLFNSRDTYDSCHYLMVPLYYAFEQNNEILINAFELQFERFLNTDKKEFNT